MSSDKKNSLRRGVHGKGISYLTYSPGVEEKAAIEAELKSEVCDKIESTNQYDKIGLSSACTRNDLYAYVSKHFSSLPPRYCLDNNIDDVIVHLKLLNQHIDRNDIVVSCALKNSVNNSNQIIQSQNDIVLITVVCYDRPKIYNKITVALDKFVLSTLDADIMTTTTGKVFDRILVELSPEYNGRTPSDLEKIFQENLQMQFSKPTSTQSQPTISNSSFSSSENNYSNNTNNQSSVSLPLTQSETYLKSNQTPPVSFNHSLPSTPQNNNSDNQHEHRRLQPQAQFSDSSLLSRLSSSDITIVKELSRNHFSVLYEGILKLNHEKVMVKKPLLPDDETKHDEYLTFLTPMFSQEVDLMLSIGSGPHICRLIGSLINGKSDMMIVYEYVGYITLDTLLRQHDYSHNGNSSLLNLIETPEQLIHIALDIANAIKHLHSLNVIYRDIKPANIMFDSYGKPKLIDFSLACFVDNEENLKPETGSYRYMAPEVIRHEKYSLSADVYSFGIFLWELYFKTVPYKGLNAIEAAYNVAKSNLRPSLPNGMNSHLRALMITCWHPNPESRPNFRDICKVLSHIQL